MHQTELGRLGGDISVVKRKNEPAFYRDIRLGMVVTNTSFVEGANWFAHPNKFYLRLRTGEDVARWMKNDFSGEWREFP
jgi:hypothetical protein